MKARSRYPRKNYSGSLYFQISYEQIEFLRLWPPFYDVAKSEREHQWTNAVPISHLYVQEELERIIQPFGTYVSASKQLSAIQWFYDNDICFLDYNIETFMIIKNYNPLLEFIRSLEIDENKSWI